jgi:hypothetical protein
MTTPAAPRKSRIPVDYQLDSLETTLRVHLAYQMSANVNMDYWQELDEPDAASLNSLSGAIDDTLADICNQYSHVKVIANLLEHARILLQNSVWSSMNVPYPRNPTLHMDRVIDNALHVYFEVIYAHLRTEMIMANHNAEVLQRTWRRCISNPSYIACRRRLMHEFNECST